MPSYKTILYVCCVLIFIGWLKTSPAYAANYIVAQDGSGDFTTISAASGQAQSGDSVQIKVGTYNETLKPNNSGSPGTPITFSNFNDDQVIISNVTTGLDLSSRSYVIIDGQVNREAYLQILIGMVK